MKKHRTVSLAVMLSLALLTVGCGGSASSSTPAPSGSTVAPAASTNSPSPGGGIPEGLKINVGHSVNTDHGYHIGLEKFKEVVEAKTGGQVTVEIHPSSSLGSEREMIEGLQLGTIDMCLAATSQLTSFEPSMQLFDLPYLFQNREHAWGVLDGEIGEEMLGKLQDKGLVGLSYFEVGFRNFTNNAGPINTPADISGKKFRLMETPVHVETIAQWGGNPVSMPIGEVYTALQTKTIDGQENPLSIILAQRLYEVQKYISVTEHFYTGTPLLIQKKLWDSYSDEFKAILIEAADAGRDACRQANLDAESKAIQIFKDAGCEINEADKQTFMDKTQGVYDKFSPQIGADLIQRVQEAAANY